MTSSSFWKKLFYAITIKNKLLPSLLSLTTGCLEGSVVQQEKVQAQMGRRRWKERDDLRAGRRRSSSVNSRPWLRALLLAGICSVLFVFALFFAVQSDRSQTNGSTCKLHFMRQRWSAMSVPGGRGAALLDITRSAPHTLWRIVAHHWVFLFYHNCHCSASSCETM